MCYYCNYYLPWGIATNWSQAAPDSKASFALPMQQSERVKLQLMAMCEQSHDRAAVGKKVKRRTVASAMAKVAELGALCVNFDVTFCLACCVPVTYLHL